MMDLALGGLKQKLNTVLQFWRLEVPNQGVSTAVPLLKCVE